MSVLAVQVDKALPHFGERRNSRHPAVYVSPRSAVPRHGPAEHNLLFGEQEPALYHRLRCAGAHQRRVGAATYQELHGFDDEGLARSGLARERSHPGAVSQLFNTHPLTGDRISKTQKNIQQILSPRPEYVINTSEYEDVRARLIQLQSQRKAPEKTAPTLLRKSEGEGKDDRPTLKLPE